jgi:hypothetical protein
MSSKVLVILEDDLDGGKADETVEFGLDGAAYAIDLSDDNAKKLRGALDGYVSKARKVSGKRSTSRKASSPVDTKAIRVGCFERHRAVHPRSRTGVRYRAVQGRR